MSEYPLRLSREGKLERIEALRSYAGGAVFHQARVAEGTHWGMSGERTVGLFAVTGPARF